MSVAGRDGEGQSPKTGTMIYGGEGVVEAVVLDDGTWLDAAEIRKQAVGGEWPPSSKQLEELEAIGFGDEIVEPPFNLSMLYDWIYLHPIHAACITQKVVDIVEIGYQFIQAPAVAQGKTPDAVQRAKFEAAVRQPNANGETIVEVLSKVAQDFEAVGNGYLEIVRTARQGEESFTLYHMPAPTVRIRRKNKGYVQIKMGKRRYFKRFGDQAKMDAQTGRVPQGTVPIDRQASEVIHFKLYTHLSEFYGAPQWLSALNAMLGDQKAREFNIEFFDNSAVPAYAVVAEGGRLTPESKTDLRTFFDKELKGKHHRTVVLDALPGIAGQNVNVKFEPLMVQIKDASFRMFRADNAEEILIAHKMPPYRVGWAKVGSLGGSTAAEMTQIYKESVIEPRQNRMEYPLNVAFQSILAITDWEFRFKDIDIRDFARELEIAKGKVILGVWSLNDAAGHLGAEAIPGPAGTQKVIWINPAAPVRVEDLPTIGTSGEEPAAGNGADGQGEIDRMIALSLTKRAPTLKARERLVQVFLKQAHRMLLTKARRYLASLDERRLATVATLLGAPHAESSPSSVTSQTAEKARKPRPLSPSERSALESLFRGIGETFDFDDLGDATLEHMRKVANWAAQSGYAHLGVSLAFDLKNPAILKVFREIAGEHIRDITETAKEDLKDLLIDRFFEEGKNPLEIARSIRSELGDEISETYRHRAETIARTETGIAQEVTQDEVFRRAGVETYTWITARDDKVRLAHQALEGIVIKVGERFPNGLRYPLDPDGPPEEIINCRCDVLPGFAEDLEPGELWDGS